jgi:hypothetical protein
MSGFMSHFLSGFMTGLGDCDFFRQFGVPFPAEMGWQARVSAEPPRRPVKSADWPAGPALIARRRHDRGGARRWESGVEFERNPLRRG